MRFSGGLRVRDAFRASTGLLRGFWAGLVLSRRDAHQYAEERTDRGHAGFARNAAVGAAAEPAGCSFGRGRHLPRTYGLPGGFRKIFGQRGGMLGGSALEAVG